MGHDATRTTPGGLYAHESGEGPVVVLIHGVMDRSSGMLRTRRILQPDVRVVRYDRRGYGRSRPAPLSDDFDRQVLDLVEVLDGRPSVVVGHSFGGIVALALAERRPDLVRSVVAYEAPLPGTISWDGATPEGGPVAPAGDGRSAAGEGAADAAEWFMRRMIGDEMWEKLPPAMRADRRAEGAAMVADLRSVQAPTPPVYVAERITVPVVAAHGSRARSRHREAAEELASRAPDAELVVLPGADHGVHLSDPRAFADLVLQGVARAV